MLIPFTQSCLNDYDDDIYDIQAEMPFNAALATVVTPSEVPGEAVIESDNDGIAYVVNPDKLTRFETNNPGQRIFYTYINAANPQLQPMADQVFSGFAARCNTYAATLER